MVAAVLTFFIAVFVVGMLPAIMNGMAWGIVSNGAEVVVTSDNKGTFLNVAANCRIVQLGLWLAVVMVGSSTVHYSGKPRHIDDFYESFESVTLINAILTYLSFLILNILGRLQDFLRKVGVIENPAAKESPLTKDFVPLYSDFEAFYTRNMYRRARDCWNRPICSAPGPMMELVDRVTHDSCWTFEYTGTTTNVMNFGSYNYLGFAESNGSCTEADVKAIEQYGLGVASPRLEAGTLKLHSELEKLVAEFVGQEAAIVFGMGFATNALNMPQIFDKNSCVISDELNHTSLILGCRLSGATVRRFKHNDMEDLERILSDAVVYGRPRSHRPFTKIFLVIEGIYRQVFAAFCSPGSLFCS
ncbi:unnamed protein product [Dibothriocephalus latus]|uniref:Aminotransferase class I/classII large domain-containing protein n=1 Tax=Dibothriocephalus latus TaxID=60516 RepID=A0A3P7LHK2_DIBLA|nr:unnamed protein product [Dibothriocephalus latus]